VLVGAGDCRPALEELARSLGCSDRVVFTGLVTNPSSCYHAFDVFALSSDTEQMPISVLEAMATALPVLSTDVGDVRGVLGTQATETVVPLDDTAAYVNVLRSLTRSDELRHALGEQNRNRVVQHFGQGLMVQRYRQIFLDVMHG
jgi:glycosyltransferase involved in cell wall biosynthesis